MSIKYYLLSIFLFLSVLTKAELKVASVLRDNMVLQRNTIIKIWGKANPNERIKVNANWNKSTIKTVSNDKGDWVVKLNTVDAGGPYTIIISSNKEKVLLENILLGEVWLCSGQSNMEMPLQGFNYQPINDYIDVLLEADNNNIRLFNLKRSSMGVPQENCNGEWVVASTESVSKFSAVGYLFAKQLQKKLKVPVGIICSSWGGSRIEAWMDAKMISNFPEALKQTTQEETLEHQYASRLYNGMIFPILNFVFKGVLWYQGESNIVNSKDYAALMVGMVKNWRSNFNIGEFPFYFVEIAPYSYGNSSAINSALLREAQLEAMFMIPNSGMVSTIDVGNETWIHPPEKDLIAKRLSIWALSETYNIKGFLYKSPTYKSMSIKDSIVTISFDNAEKGMTSFGKEVECFEIAGKDSIFYPAKLLTLKNRKVEIYSDKVKVPVAVRYGFCNFPKTSGYLYNTAGLPLPSFRTDTFIK